MDKFVITVGARSSPLSKVQVNEVYQEILQSHPHLEFEHIFIETTGDKDRETSLRQLDKTDFFTKEIDHLLLTGQCRLAIHSAKDLPEPLPQGLTIAAITKGVDPSDVLVLRPGVTLDQLSFTSIIATSSKRREEQVRMLKPNLSFCDVRGTIGERLALLDKNQVDGVVIAEAALIRLGLTHLNRIRLPGGNVPYQGQLALVCRLEDKEILEIFRCLDDRKKNPTILHVGLDVPDKMQNHRVIHYPVIRIDFRPSEQSDISNGFKDIDVYTHVLFSSKNVVHAFFRHFSHFGFKPHHLYQKKMICVGQQTAKTLKAYGIHHTEFPVQETAEGMIELLQSSSLKEAYFFWPHSALSRSVLREFFHKTGLRYKECVIYDTVVNRSLAPLDLTSIDEIHFTSPSTVDAFIDLFGQLPKNKVLKAIGPITEQKIQAVLSKL